MPFIAPMFKLLLALMAGILLAQYASMPFYLAWGACILLVLSMAILPRAWWLQVSLGFQLAGVLLGMGVVDRVGQQWKGSQAADGEYSRHLFWVENVQFKKWGTRATAELLDDQGNRTGKLVSISLHNDAKVGIGDVITFSARLRVPRKAEVPYEFDKAAYLASQGIYLECSVWDGEIRKLGMVQPSALGGWAYSLRSWIGRILDAAGMGGQSTALAKALLLGDKGGLEFETRESFAAAGGIHVLAVSGLHAGILISFILALCRPMGKGRKGRVWVTVVALLVLWVFAAITGFSPSVTRASLMFTFLYVGRAIRPDVPGMASISLAALLILVFDPQALFQLGFLLSFSAILGMVFLAEPIRDFLFPRSFRFARVADLLAVSLAAQVATLPITLHAFHQFPVFFLITNLFLIPWAWLGLTTLLLALLLSPIPFLGEWMFHFCDMLLGGGAWLVEEVASLPGALEEGIRLPYWSALVLAMLVVSGYFALVRHSAFSRRVMVASSLVLALSAVVGRWDAHPPRLIVDVKSKGWSAQFSKEGRSVILSSGDKNKWFLVRTSTMNRIHDLEPEKVTVQQGCTVQWEDLVITDLGQEGILVRGANGEDTVRAYQTLVMD